MEIFLMILLLYIETVVVSSIFLSLGIFKMIKNINMEKYKLIYKDEKELKSNIFSYELIRNLFVPGYNFVIGSFALICSNNKDFMNYVFEQLKNDGSIEKMTPEEYTRYLNNPNYFTSSSISREYYNNINKAHKIKVKNGVIYFDIRNNNIKIIKSEGKVSELSEKEQIELMYENELFYKDIYKKGELEYLKSDIKDKLFLKEMKNNVLVHESKLKNTKLDQINDTKNMLKKMKNDILLLELDISKKERNNNSKKLMKTFK